MKPRICKGDSKLPPEQIASYVTPPERNGLESSTVWRPLFMCHPLKSLQTPVKTGHTGGCNFNRINTHVYSKFIHFIQLQCYKKLWGQSWLELSSILSTTHEIWVYYSTHFLIVKWDSILYYHPPTPPPPAQSSA